VYCFVNEEIKQHCLSGQREEMLSRLCPERVFTQCAICLLIQAAMADWLLCSASRLSGYKERFWLQKSQSVYPEDPLTAFYRVTIEKVKPIYTFILFGGADQ
jgi:hypothetical protein